MLVVKILPAKGNNFNGIAYNEKKIDEEKSSLFVAKNFEGLDAQANKNDYIMYLQNHSKANTRIKKPQFHASVSGKGKETSFDDLVKFGEHYMNEMGYGENPYLIYKHTDTKNNHIHIVSSRVDTNGKKIKDSLERVRSQKIINQYFGIDTQKKIEAKLKEINKYSIKNIAQYKLLLEKHFNKVIENKDSISIYMSDKKLELKKIDIDKKIEKSKNKGKALLKRKEALKEYLLELSKKHTLEETIVLAEKDNIFISVFKTKDGDKNFGYTIIDKKTKSVFKGSEILPLKILELNKAKTNEIEGFLELLNKLRTKESTLRDINNELNRVGKYLDENGNVYNINQGENEKVFNIKKSLVFDFNYNSRLEEIQNKYKPQSKQDVAVLSFLFKVKRDDININSNDELKEARSRMGNFYNYTLEFFLKNNNDFKEQLKSSGINLIKYQNNFFIVDTEKKFIGNIDLKEETRQQIENNGWYINIHSGKEYEKMKQTNYALENILTDIKYLFDYSDEEPKKRRRKRNIGNSY